MDVDLMRALWKFSSWIDRECAEGGRPGAVREWNGAGLCVEAQADGVPCTTARRSCEICSRAIEDKRRP